MNYEDTVWVQENEPQWETNLYGAFLDKYPVSNGHMLFIPKTTEWPDRERALASCFKAAYAVGAEKVRVGECQGFNVGMNNGEAAGQTIPYSHVHLILRNEGDCADPIGGVRGVIPGQGNYHSSKYTLPE